MFLVALLGLVMATGLSWYALEDIVLESSWSQMRNAALLAARTWEHQEKPSLPLDPKLTVHLTVADPTGKVLDDTFREPDEAINLAGRPEFEAALQGKEGRDRRFNRTTQEETLMLAVPLRRAGRIVGVLRVALPASVVRARMAELQRSLLLAFVLAAVLAGGLAELITRSMLKPLHAVRDALHSGSAEPYPESGPQEIRELTRALNEKREEAIRQNATLATQHDRLERILDRLNDGIVVLDPGGDVVYANPAALDILGVTRDALAERDFGARADLAGRVLSLAGQPGDHSEQMDVAETDRHLMVDTLEIAWGSGSGELRARVMVLRDISHFVRLDRTRQEFVANASHELRTPITAVATSLEALELGALDDVAHRPAFLARARRAVEKLSRLANDLLDLSMAEGMPQDAVDENTRCDAAEVAIQVMTTSSAVAAGKGQKLLADVPETPVLVPMRESDFLRVLGNLVDNALKYTPEEGTVEITVAVEGREAVVTVDDNGPGVPHAVRNKIFDRFFRAERSRYDGGAGLGLTIARLLLQRRGGRVVAEESPLGGARFRLTLPLADERRAESTAHLSDARRARP